MKIKLTTGYLVLLFSDATLNREAEHATTYGDGFKFNEDFSTVTQTIFKEKDGKRTGEIERVRTGEVYWYATKAESDAVTKLSNKTRKLLKKTFNEVI